MNFVRLDAQRRAEMLYNYKLYSYRQLSAFSKYAWRTAKKVSENYGGTRLAIWLDMMWCNLRYGAMYDRDYTLFEFYRKSSRERNKFLTFRRYYKLIKSLDKRTFFSLMDKPTMYRKYAEFIKRDWLLADDQTSDIDINEFVKNHHMVLVKPVSSDQGNGITIISESDDSAVEHVLSERLKQALLLEELCENCRELNEINATSLNTLRVYTIVIKNNEVDIASTSLRCGCGDSVVDNWGSGGVGYLVNPGSGAIEAPGIDKNGVKHMVHPGTNLIMPGFKVPRYQEACELAKKIIAEDKKVVYAGLDLAILPDRIELIEVNFPGGHDFLQALDLVGKKQLFDHLYK